MPFHDVRFPPRISFGSTGGPERLTEIVTTASGFEERNSPWAHSRRRYDAGVGMRSLDDVAEVVAFFEARMGRLHGFRWKDWSDYKSCAPSGEVRAGDQLIGTGDGIARRFRLVKAYESGAQSYLRPITMPVAGSVIAAVGSMVGVEGTDFEVDPTTGEVIFAVAPADGVAVTAGFEFDVAVRFDTDAIHTSVASFGAGEVPDIPLVEIRT